jgi:hypothetical protein
MNDLCGSCVHERLSNRFDALARGIYPLSDERLPEVFESNQLSCEVDVNVRISTLTIRMSSRCIYLFVFLKKLRELQRDLGEIGHKKKSATRPDEIDELIRKHDVNIMNIDGHVVNHDEYVVFYYSSLRENVVNDVVARAVTKR